jgi:hypothetical protein
MNCSLRHRVRVAGWGDGCGLGARNDWHRLGRGEQLNLALSNRAIMEVTCERVEVLGMEALCRRCLGVDSRAAARSVTRLGL